MSGTRRTSSRAKAQTIFYTEATEADGLGGESGSEASDAEMDEEEEEEEEEEPVRRKSSRSTKFRACLKDAPDGISDLLRAVPDEKRTASTRRSSSRRSKSKRSTLEEVDSDEDDVADSPPKRRTRKAVAKSPAKRHAKRRMSKAHAASESDFSDEGSDSEDDEEGDGDVYYEDDEEGEFWPTVIDHPPQTTAGLIEQCSICIFRGGVHHPVIFIRTDSRNRGGGDENQQGHSLQVPPHSGMEGHLQEYEHHRNHQRIALDPGR